MGIRWENLGKGIGKWTVGRCEEVKGPEREGELRVNWEEEKGEEEADSTHRVRHRSQS